MAPILYPMTGLTDGRFGWADYAEDEMGKVNHISTNGRDS
jgi:hypothetical protein